MTHRFSPDLTALRHRVETFAAKEALPVLITSEDFPRNLWSTMGQKGLLGLGIPEEYGGSGGTWITIQAVGESLVRGCSSIGLALSWLIHVLLSRFMIMGLGTRDQMDQWLPRLARGETTIALAISEPRVGSHPRHLRTFAAHEGTQWRLQGEKNYLSNGPLAGVFLVLAVSSGKGSAKGFTAFLAPRDTKGLRLTETIRSETLKPSILCGMKLESCVLPEDSVLGPPERAYDTVSKPFRDLEDTLLMGPVVGATAVQISRLAALIRNQEIERSDELKRGMGELQSHLDTLRVLAVEAAAMIDSSHRDREYHSTLLYFRRSVGHFQSTILRLIEQGHIETDEAFRTLTNDIAFTIGIARNVAMIRRQQMGEALLLEKDSHYAEQY
ncbi:MAG: acyl-CoA dehydrogenase family protein [Syntrophales bacterium]|jgi:acyl-CoA dehydrogenase|nr:acyl-CoA dehydrogenase family protein [Syntrophales bacterium]MCK9528349.1 acyl-CoA dehydrogenase family protein [Syntrophales bacterium]MDX9922726.1 acyl-CoA dehydrogenase family protein [Syntrophales bacterium]